MKYLFIVLSLSLFGLSAKAYTERNFLQKLATPQQVEQVLLPTEKWVSYPAYMDREGWGKLTQSVKETLIANGEKYLDYTWKVVKATDYLEYERSGDRKIMETAFGSNNSALSHLVFAELAEGKGRFMDQIINGVWYTCDMPSWVLSAHLVAQKTKRNLPDFREEIIDLTSGDMGSLLSWAWYFFHDAWDQVNPVISLRVKHLIQQRILEPYMQRSDYWWQAFSGKKDALVNNWNVWCNFNVLTCFLLMEDNPQARAAGVYKTMRSVDEFLNYVKEDGACEEGPSYWGHAAGKLYDYLQILSYATGGKISLFDNPMIKNMGEYIGRSYVGNGWVVNFADASAQGGDAAIIGLIFRYGKAVRSEEMQRFAAYLFDNLKSKDVAGEGRDFFRRIEDFASYQQLPGISPALPQARYSWYPQTEFCYMKNKTGFFFASKGGYNDESHNHNDVGTFSLYIDTLPFFIDAGVGTYTRQTFSSERYKIWTMQSDYHNLPVINGFSQQAGARYKSKDATFNAGKQTFSLDIAGAYPAGACQRWVRSYALKDKALVITDDFKLDKNAGANIVHFMTWAEPDISQPGRVVLKKNGKQAVLKYDGATFSPSVEVVPLTDSRLSNVWGDKIYRLALKAKSEKNSGKYIFEISK
ncbi:MAG: heparinase II/III family protein [Niabella sp.]